MNMRTMKALDHYAGIPICLLLDLCQKVRSLLPRRKKTRHPARILVIKFFGMGSILLASPMLRALRQRYPETEIGFLTFSSNRDMVERIGLVDHVHTLSTDSIVSFARDLINVLWQVRAARYDATIDIEFFSKFSTIMTYLSGSSIRIGYFLRQLWRGDLLTDQVYYNQYKHITEVIGALAAPLQVQIQDFSIQKPRIHHQEREEAERLLAASGIESDSIVIGINVNVSDLSLERRWPKESFQRLAEALLRELDAHLLFVGGAGDSCYVQDVVADFNGNERVVDLSGKTSLGVLLGVIDRCNLFITNDSGPLHLAAALCIPTVSFFGPETPSLYGPKGGDALVFHEQLYCSPCLNVFNVKTAPCGGVNICLSAITVDAVLAGIRNRYPDLWTHDGRASRRGAIAS